MTRHETLCEISRIDWVLETQHLTYAEKRKALEKRLGLIELLAQFNEEIR